MKLKALLFDVDGTLAETEKDLKRVAFNRAFKRLNLAHFWDEDLYGELVKVAGSSERLRFYFERYCRTTRIRRLRRMFDEIESEAWLEVDGGSKASNAAEVVAAGAIVLVAGSAVFGGPRSVAENVAVRAARPSGSKVVKTIVLKDRHKSVILVLASSFK